MSWQTALKGHMPQTGKTCRISLGLRLRSSICGGSLRLAFGVDAPLIHAGLLPPLAGVLDRVDAGCLPPSLLIPGTVYRAVMDTAERHRELIAGLAAERARLQVAQVMRVGGLPPTD